MRKKGKKAVTLNNRCCEDIQKIRVNTEGITMLLEMSFILKSTVLFWRIHSDPLSDELPAERKWQNVLLLPAAAQPGQWRVPRVFKLREAQLVEDVINSGSGSHLPQKRTKYYWTGDMACQDFFFSSCPLWPHKHMDFHFFSMVSDGC